MRTINNTIPKYSFVIPAYNAEATITRTIESIASKMESYEIIVAENGSDDKTSEIVMKQVEENNKIRLIHTGKGVSKARNGGIAAAEGEWLIFVDADDVWIGDEASLNILTYSLQAADLIVCSYQKDGNNIVHSYEDQEHILSGEQKSEMFRWLLSRPTLRMTVWAKLYRRDTVISSGVCFDESLRLSEDADFLIRLFAKCNRVSVSGMVVYRYCTDTPSVVRSTDRTRTEGYLTALDTIAGRIPEDMKTAKDEFVLAHLNLICVHDIYTSENGLTIRERRREIKRVLQNQIIQEAVFNTRCRDLVNLNKVPAFFFRHKLYSLGGLVCRTKSLMNRRKQNKAKKNRK